MPSPAASAEPTASGSLPLMTSPKFGTATVRPSVRMTVASPPMPSVQPIAFGIFRDGSLTSSAMSPHASKP